MTQLKYISSKFNSKFHHKISFCISFRVRKLKIWKVTQETLLDWHCLCLKVSIWVSPTILLRVWTRWTPVGNTAIATYLEKVSKKSSDNNNILNLIYLWLTHFQSSYIVLFKNAFFERGIFNLGEFTLQNAWKYIPTGSNNF